MRADRLLSILLRLQASRRLTARALAQDLEVSERTIHRDMEALCAAGIPIYAQRGTGGGWHLDDDYRTNLTGLSEAEIQVLFLAPPTRLLADLGLHGAADAAAVKLFAALPSARRRDAEYARGRIHVDTAGWHHPEEAAPALPALQDAVWRECKVEIAYERGDGAAVERRVDPLGLVAKGRLWYLVAAVDGEPRTYRVSRVRSARLLEEPCARPPDFDLASYWAQSSADFVTNLPRYRITVRAAPEIMPWLSGAGWYMRVERVGEPDASGWITLHLLLQSEEEACRYALGFGTRMEVLEPPELRDRVAERAAAVVDFYRRCGGRCGPGRPQ